MLDPDKLDFNSMHYIRFATEDQRSTKLSLGYNQSKPKNRKRLQYTHTVSKQNSLNLPSI